MFELDDLLNALNNSEFEEIPVDVQTFVTSKEYLGLPPLSAYQILLIEMATQIYSEETLHNIYEYRVAANRWKQTKREVIMMLGKGSGKDYCSTIACAYVVYLLLCLKDPQSYYQKPPGDAIDIVNIAINADQASRVFFRGIVQRIKNSPWFKGKYNAKFDGEPAQSNEIHFSKNINLYSGHSQRESFEGYNFIFVILDEIAGFAMESNTGNYLAATADEVYKTYANSVLSRFPEHGKLLMLSFPRYKGDFITKRYEQVIAEKETILREQEVMINPELPDIPDNYLTIRWEEDHIMNYSTPGVFALRRPSWEVNPTKKIENYLPAFIDNSVDAASRFACMPPDAVDAFFKDRTKIEAAFTKRNGVETDGRFLDEFKPIPGKRYFVHVDLARLHDNCAVALAHVDSWQQRRIGGSFLEPVPFVVVDAVRWWTPTKDKSVNFEDVREYIVSLKNRGFDVHLTTFDRWESADMMQYLSSVGMRNERLSVAKKHYEDMAMVVGEERVYGPHIELLIDELLSLQITRNDKVDHPRKKSKDLSDAVCGAIYNAIAHTPRDLNEEIEIKTLDSLREETRNRIPAQEPKADSVIRVPKSMPGDLEDYMSRLFTI